MNITYVKKSPAFQLGYIMSSFPLTFGGTSTTCGKSAAIKGLSCLSLLTGRMFGQGRPSMKLGVESQAAGRCHQTCTWPSVSWGKTCPAGSSCTSWAELIENRADEMDMSSKEIILRCRQEHATVRTSPRAKNMSVHLSMAGSPLGVTSPDQV